MRVHLARKEETSGLLKKKTQYVVTYRAEFDDAELAAIKRGGIEDAVFWQDGEEKEEYLRQTITVKMLSHKKGWEVRVPNISLAKEAEETLKAKFRGLKQMIEDAMGDTDTSETFDL